MILPAPAAAASPVTTSPRPLLASEPGPSATTCSSLYRSFWIAGFEGADHVNGKRVALDLVAASGHVAHLEDDYRRAAALGLRTVRESIGWRLCEPGDRPGGPRYDFARVQRFAESAQRHGLQVLWTLMHYGMPGDVGVFDPNFADRFADFAAAAARALAGHGDAAPVYTPVNEIGFLAWAITESDLVHPHRPAPGDGPAAAEARRQLGWQAKCRLVQAALRAIEAIRAEDPRARFLHVEPVIHVVPPLDALHRADAADAEAADQWQSWDLLRGTLLPELGGNPRALDLMGVNHYHNGQFEHGSRRPLEWHLDDPRRVSFSSLLRQVWKRYERPLIVAETSHVGSGRARWLEHMAAEVERALRTGVPVQGVCLYPVVDRPDWQDASHWHRSGLWDVDPAPRTPGAPPLQRRLVLSYAKALRRAQQRLPRPPSGIPMPHLIVFSHLRWNSVFQRPQHLLSRLARYYHVVVVEEPVRTAERAHLERSSPVPGVEVLRPHTPVAACGFHDDQLSVLGPLLARYLEDNVIDDTIAWFCTPMALPLLAGLQPRCVVYDCMDELSAFLEAPRQMSQRETALLKSAQLVLTGGPSLYEAKRALHPNVLCLPSGVDAQHYAPANATARPLEMRRASALQGGLAHPRLGFFGVIDERIDLGLVAELADADPGWQVIMVGPVVKIDAASLPQRPNLHWLGEQPYGLLPQLVAGWEVCLMPFALNDATRFISPTKTLEYMAAGKPIVSTAVHDVRAMFSDVVAIAQSKAGFVEACQAALREMPHQRNERIAEMQACVWRHSWNDTALAVHHAIDQLLAQSPVRQLHAAKGHALAGVPCLAPAVRGRGAP